MFKNFTKVSFLATIIVNSLNSAALSEPTPASTPVSKPKGPNKEHRQLPGLIMGGHLYIPDESGAYRMPGKLVGAKAGFVDLTGRFILAPKYEDAAVFSEGIAGVRIDGKWGFVDRTGKLVIPPTLCAVKFDGYWRYIDKKGNYAMDAKFAGSDSRKMKMLTALPATCS